MKILLDVDDDSVDAIVVKSLTGTRENMLLELTRQKTSRVFSFDNDKDKKKIKKFVKSLNKVIEFYGGTSVEA